MPIMSEEGTIERSKGGAQHFPAESVEINGYSRGRSKPGTFVSHFRLQAVFSVVKEYVSLLRW